MLLSATGGARDFSGASSYPQVPVVKEELQQGNLH